LLQKVSKLEAALENMKVNFADTIDECAKARQTIRMLETELDNQKENEYNQIALSEKIEMLQNSNDKLAANKNSLVVDYEADSRKSKLINNRLNQEMSDLREKHQDENAQIVKNHELEIKSLQKDLKAEKNENLNLRSNLSSLKEK
jgi:hypothetical protein